jgi:hypothetical protein
MIKIVRPRVSGRRTYCYTHNYLYLLSFIDDSDVEEIVINHAEGDYRDDIDHTARLGWQPVVTPTTTLKPTLHRHVDGSIVAPGLNGKLTAYSQAYMPMGNWKFQWDPMPSTIQGARCIPACRLLTLHGPDGIQPMYVTSVITFNVFDKRQYTSCSLSDYGWYPDGTRVRRYTLQYDGLNLPEWRKSGLLSYENFRDLDNAARRSSDVRKGEEAREYAYSMISGYESVSTASLGTVNLKQEYIPIEDLKRSLSLCDLTLHKLPYVDRNYLAQRAYQDLGYIDNNGIAYLLDSLRLEGTIESFVSSLKSVLRTRGKKRAKAFASSYLSEHYGLRLQLLDTIEYVKNISSYSMSISNRRCAGEQSISANGWQGTARYQCYYSWSPETISDVTNELLSYLDTVPSLENIWDMIPLSFVIDWFISLGDELTALDNAVNLTTKYDVHGWTLTTYLQRAVEPSMALTGLAYNLEEKYFSRQVGKTPIIPLPPIDTESTSSLPSHFCEGAALYVART